MFAFFALFSIIVKADATACASGDDSCLPVDDEVSMLLVNTEKIKAVAQKDVHLHQQAPDDHAGHNNGGSEDPDPDHDDGSEHSDSEVSTEHPEELLQKDRAERMNKEEGKMNKEARQVQAMVKEVREGKSKSLNLLQVIDLAQKAYTPRSDYTSEELIEAIKGLDVNNNSLLEKEELTVTHVTEADANSTEISSGWSWKPYSYDYEYGYLRSSIEMYFVPHAKLPDGLNSPKTCYIMSDSAMFYGNDCWSKYTYTNLHKTSGGKLCRCFSAYQSHWKLYHSSVGNRVYKNYP